MLREAWLAWCDRVGFDSKSQDSIYERMEAAYAEPTRFYHTFSHIRHCLSEWEVMRNDFPVGEDRLAIEAAIWFHDVIYRPEASDNELRSAEWAATAMEDGGLEPDFIEQVKRLILVTDHRRLPRTEAENWICDIDLSILGQPASAYEAYAAAIRQEYHFVSASSYRIGRAAVLQSFLDREWIFATPYFRGRYESLARSNLQSEISQWTGGFETGTA